MAFFTDADPKYQTIYSNETSSQSIIVFSQEIFHKPPETCTGQRCQRY